MRDIVKDIDFSLVQQKNKYYVYIISLVAAVGGFLFGYDLSIISGAIIFLKKSFHLDAGGVGFAVSSAVIGCIIGCFFAGVLSDFLGRKWGLMFAAILFGVSAVGTAMAQTFFEFNVYRALGGLGVGLASILSPMYIAEIAPPKIRGRLVTLNQFAVVIGLLSSIIVAYQLSFTENWRWMFGSECVPIVFFAFGLLLVPQSPRWLLEKNKLQKAANVLTKINGKTEAEKEITEIHNSITAESGAFSELFQPGIRIALLIAVALAAFQQLAGVSTVMFYAPIIFQKAGFENASDAILCTIFQNIWVIICTVTAIWLVDRIGRRPLLILGLCGMGLGQILLGVFFFYNLGGYAFLIIMFLTIAAYTMSIAPLAWLIMSEIFPTRIRGKAMAIASITLWITCFIANQVFPVMRDYFEKTFETEAGAFWVFAIVCFIAVAFSWKMVPETKGRTLEEIGASWTKKT